MHQVVIDTGHCLDQFLVTCCCGLFQIFWNVDDFVFGTFAFILPDQCLHCNEIHHTFEVALKANWNLDGYWISAETGDDGIKRSFKRRSGSIQFVDEANARHAVFVGLTPNRFRLGFHSCDTIKDCYCTIKHPQRTLDFHCEVNVARRVDDVDAVVDTVSFPETGRRGAGNRNAALLLLLHPVHRRRTLVHLANLVRDARVIKDTFCGRGLTGIDVGHDADIPEFL
jgi:hypothetical protein